MGKHGSRPGAGTTAVQGAQEPWSGPSRGVDGSRHIDIRWKIKAIRQPKRSGPGDKLEVPICRGCAQNFPAQSKSASSSICARFSWSRSD